MSERKSCCPKCDWQRAAYLEHSCECHGYHEPKPMSDPSIPELVKRLRGFNPPDRTVDWDKPAAQAIHDAANALERLERERDEARDLYVETENSRHKALLEMDRAHAVIAELREALDEYGEHGRDCAGAGWEGGRPTPDGGYEMRMRGKWYQTKPVDERPKCDCGLVAALSKVPETEMPK